MLKRERTKEIRNDVIPEGIMFLSPGGSCSLKVGTTLGMLSCHFLLTFILNEHNPSISA